MSAKKKEREKGGKKQFLKKKRERINQRVEKAAERRKENTANKKSEKIFPGANIPRTKLASCPPSTHPRLASPNKVLRLACNKHKTNLNR